MKQKSSGKSSVIDRKIVFDGKWLKFEHITYRDGRGGTRQWENITRTGRGGAVAIIPILSPSNRVLFVRQFRPPLDGYIIEFPAGLIDSGEGIETAALRELKEETGYVGRIRKVTVPVYNSPGLTDETVSIVTVDIDETLECNLNPEQCSEPTEDIEVLPAPINDLEGFVESRIKAGDRIDAKVMSFVLWGRTVND